MKLVGTFSLFGAACGLSAIHDEQWTSWKREFGVSYPPSEDLRRYAIYQDNLEFISKHNSRYEQGQETYTVALNQFASMGQAEFSGRYLSVGYGEKETVQEYPCPEVFQDDGSALPASLSYIPTKSSDVRVTSVKDTNNCDLASWAFSASAAVEAVACASGLEDCSTWEGVSAQQMIDCASYTPQTWQTNPLVINLNPWDNHACKRGYHANAIRYAFLNGGIQGWSEYPYVSGKSKHEEDCTYDNSTALLNPVSSCGAQPIYGDEGQLAQVLAQKGPVAAQIDAAGSGFQFYSGGVYSNTRCSTSNLNQFVTIVGYGSDTADGVTTDYWEVKNSWGTRWGDDGYILMQRNFNNMCGIASDAVYALP